MSGGARRWTQQRRAIAQVLAGATAPMTADEVRRALGGQAAYGDVVADLTAMETAEWISTDVTDDPDPLGRERRFYLDPAQRAAQVLAAARPRPHREQTGSV